ncbi:hypothetical protein [Saccharothrix longispora]|uniref:hypothetical protein n=1 Tax=Saccharothrix longispora TaxID=33920 RepID=UPI0028FCFD7A|nr:hypothetical protein [Saccharothrix longispora]MDU0290755.1 hypothetical protein [Saccharothrix longispora]
MAEPVFAVVAPPTSAFPRRPHLIALALSAVVCLASSAALLSVGMTHHSTPIRGVMASKKDYFEDPEVARLLMEEGVRIHITDSRGSQNIVKGQRPPEYDFVMPSGHVVGESVVENWGGSSLVPFTSPLVVVGFRDYVDGLVRAEVAQRQPDQPRGADLYYYLDMGAFVGLSAQGTKWRDLGVRSDNRIRAYAPDACRSYSGAAYLGLVSGVLSDNGEPPTWDPEAGRGTVPDTAARISPWWESGGLPDQGLADKFFGAEGPTFAPLAVVYEHQYLDYQMRHVERTGSPDTTRAVLYPSRHHQSEPWLVSFNDQGDRLIELLRTNRDLRKRAAEIGFRPTDPQPGELTLADALAARKLPMPSINDTGSRAVLPNRPALAALIKEVTRCSGSGVPW